MKYFVKNLNKDTWLKLFPTKFSQEEIDKFAAYLTKEGNQKRIKAFNDFKSVLQDYQVALTSLPSYYKNSTEQSYLYMVYMPYFTTDKNVSHDLNELKKQSDTFEKLLPYFKALKNIKLDNKYNSTTLYQTLKAIKQYASKLPWYTGDTLDGIAQEDSVESVFVQSESYAIFSDRGYLNTDGYMSSHLSGARLFPSLENAKRSLAHKKGEVAVVKIKVEFQDVVMGANKTTDTMKSFIEKKRIEEFLNSTNIEMLKEKLAEYEKQLNVQPKDAPKKKVKI